MYGWTFSPAAELIRTIDPPPRRTRWGAPTMTVCQAPVRLMPIWMSPHLGRRIRPRRAHGHTCVGDDDVQAAEFGDGGVHLLAHPDEVADVALDRQRTAAAELDQPDRLVEVGLGRRGIREPVDLRTDVEHDDVGPLP